MSAADAWAIDPRDQQRERLAREREQRPLSNLNPGHTDLVNKKDDADGCATGLHHRTTHLHDPALLGAALGDIESWQAWRIILKAAFGLTLNREEARAFAAVAGERKPPAQRVRELWAIVGRRGGKSRMAAALAIYLALFGEHRLARGERGMVLGAGGLARSSPWCSITCVVSSKPVRCCGRRSSTPRRTRSSCATASSSRCTVTSFRTIRGRTLMACILDEVAFWRDETSARPTSKPIAR